MTKHKNPYVIMRSDLSGYLSWNGEIICHPDKKIAKKIAKDFAGIVKTLEEAKEIMDKVNDDKKSLTYEDVHKYKGVWFYWNRSATKREGSFVTREGAEAHRQIYLGDTKNECTCADEAEGFQCSHCQEMKHNL